MNNDNNVKVLDELNKGCCMGTDSLKFILDKVDNDDFRELIEKQYDMYDEISNKINEMYDSYSDDKPNETSTMNKVMIWSSIQMSTFGDDSTSKLAEMLIQGTEMGIVEGRKLLNHKEMDDKIKKLINKYIGEQEKFIEKLKKYL